MKKTIILFSAIILSAGLTFGQTPQKQDKATPAPKTQTTTTAPAKDPKAGCDEKTMKQCAGAKEAKSGCCAHDKAAKSDAAKETKAPEKK
jgi:hypothetical protein